MAVKILVVEDDPDTLRLLDDILSESGYKVVKARSISVALDKLREEKIDLVLIDILLPNVDGRELSRKIRKDPELKDVKIIYISILEYSEYVERYGKDDLEKLNISGYITKPFEYKKVIETITDVLSIAEK